MHTHKLKHTHKYIIKKPFEDKVNLTSRNIGILIYDERVSVIDYNRTNSASLQT